MERKAGVLLPIFSLPSDYGIGTLGVEAQRFIDFLVDAKQSYWQILPIGPTSFGDSPYQSFSSYAGNPYFIDLDLLVDQGYLDKNDFINIDWGNNINSVDYEKLYLNRFEVLKKAVKVFLKKEYGEYQRFLENEKGWVVDYALFMTIKNLHHGKAFRAWDDKYKKRDNLALNKLKREHKAEFEFWVAIQYLFFKQWNSLKEYANNRGISIIGDLPIYVASDSVEVWSNPNAFKLDDDYNPIVVAGCPPDGFTDDGQRWGNPIYDYEYLKKNNYKFWIDRIRQQMRFYDVLRLDHFRGFAGYYEIPASEKTAKVGSWKKGPGIELFKAIENELGKLNIIAEDLGFLTDDVYELLEETGYAGMKNMLFAFYPDNPDSEYLPHNFVKNCVVYAGTHDNEPIMGWFKDIDKKCSRRAIEYLHLDKKEGYNWGMIRAMYQGIEDTCIVQFQDFLGLGYEARINTPSTLGINWLYRINRKDLSKSLSKKIRNLVDLYQR